RIRQDEDPESPRETILENRDELRIEEWLAAGESDFFRTPTVPFDLVEINRDLAPLEIDQPVVLRARFDVAVAAGDIAKRSGIEPKSFQPLEHDARARLAVGREKRVFELARIERGRPAAINSGPKLLAGVPLAAPFVLRVGTPGDPALLDRHAAMCNLLERQHIAGGP